MFKFLQRMGVVEQNQIGMTDRIEELESRVKALEDFCKTIAVAKEESPIEARYRGSNGLLSYRNRRKDTTELELRDVEVER
jgi:hypothetical protein